MQPNPQFADAQKVGFLRSGSREAGLRRHQRFELTKLFFRGESAHFINRLPVDFVGAQLVAIHARNPTPTTSPPLALYNEQNAPPLVLESPSQQATPLQTRESTAFGLLRWLSTCRSM